MWHVLVPSFEIQMADMHTSLTGPLMIEVVVTDMVSVVCLFCHDKVFNIVFSYVR